MCKQQFFLSHGTDLQYNLGFDFDNNLLSNLISCLCDAPLFNNVLPQTSKALHSAAVFLLRLQYKMCSFMLQFSDYYY